MMKDKIADKSKVFERHVVLIAPEVHWNTGNIGRTCLGAGAILHLVRPLGFSLESRQVKRAGLDYWPSVRLSVWEHFEEFRGEMRVRREEVCLFAKRGEKNFRSMPFSPRQFLVFGSETRGLPKIILSMYQDTVYHIPISDKIRCLNLSTSVGIALYESMRVSDPFHVWPPV